MLHPIFGHKPCWFCNKMLYLQSSKLIPAIEDTQHYPCLNSCLAIRCMKYCYAILSKLLILSQYLNHNVD